MAAWRDIEGRAERLGATALYFGTAPKWLMNAARAAIAAPVVVNVKGQAPDNVIVLTTLAEYERLAGTRSVLADASAADLAILAPDMAEITADS